MKLQKHTTRILGKKEYEKWVIVVPKLYIDKLGWKNGQNLMAEAQGQLLLVRPGVKEKGGKELKAKTYEEFRAQVEKGLRDEREGITWMQLREKEKIDSKRPFNQWVRKLDKDLGLIREKREGKTYWRLPR